MSTNNLRNCKEDEDASNVHFDEIRLRCLGGDAFKPGDIVITGKRAIFAQGIQ